MSNKEAIKRFADSPSESKMTQIIELAKRNELTNDEIAFLSRCLANSGSMLNPSNETKSCDIPSTGGPSSLSTILCPLIIREFGFTVPKLGVRGRPAGGVDVLGHIPHYRIEYDAVGVEKCLKESGYCHFLANKNFAPLDALLFAFRSKVGAVDVAPLVIASILSKKIALGIETVGLDVRVFPNGNFGETWNEARNNAKRFISVAQTVGIHATCILNDLTVLQQPYIGRGEALVAIRKLLEESADNKLEEHFEQCVKMTEAVTNNRRNETKSLAVMARAQFERNLTAQGSNWDNFISRTEVIVQTRTYPIKAKKAGFLDIDLARIRDAVVWGQASSKTSIATKFPDPCGLVFHKTNNELVEEGETILSLRAESDVKDELIRRVTSSIAIEDVTKEVMKPEIVYTHG